MNKVWEIIIDIFLGIGIMFISVMMYFGLRTETVMKSVYENVTEEFITDVKENGVIKIRDYEKFIEGLGIGNNLFNVSLEHRYKILEPEYRFKTLEEIIEEQSKKYTGTNDYHYKEVVTERPHVNDPVNDGNLNKETNESIIEKAENTPADPNHVHDENCYDGHRHTGSKIFIHKHAHKSGECREFIKDTYVISHCRDCGNNYFGGETHNYWDAIEKTVKTSYSNYSGTAKCPECNSKNVTSEDPLYYYGYSCGYDKEIMSGDPAYAGVKTPYDIEYEYKREYPQYVTGGTFASGCYTYHQVKSIGHSFNYNDYGSLIRSSVWPAIQKMIYTDKIKNYCIIPEYYRIGLYDTNWYEHEILEDGYFSKKPNLCYITYKAYVDNNGALKFKYISYWIKTASSSWYENYDNPGFPDDLTVNQFVNINRTRIIELFKQTTGIDYEEYNKTYGVTLYIHCLNSELLSECIKICDFDHKQSDRWITTCGYEEDGTLACDQIIASLIPTHSTQKVYTGDPLITTAKATYKNGSTKIVVCTTDFSTSNICKDQDVTLVYNYSIDGKSYSKTCNITVTIIPRNKSCHKGHVYNLNADGTDPGCPYCRAWIENLRVIYPTISPIVITIGTTLQENNVTLLATYMDGHTEEVTSGYIDNLDKNYLGTMQVTIGYKGASTTVLVTTVRAKIKCDICDYEYELYPDGTNPGCPRCIQKTPVFTGNIMEYEHINHTDEILKTLYDKGEYIFNIDDVFCVSVKNKSTTMARTILKRIFPTITDQWFKKYKSEYILNR